MGKRLLFILVVVWAICYFQTNEAAITKVVCYYEEWAARTFPPDLIDTDICTHVIFAFLGLTPDGTLNWAQLNETTVKSLRAKKEQNPSLTLLLGVNGVAVNFTFVAANQNLTDIFANDVKTFLDKYGFDGCDIDWEYPGWFGGNRTTDGDNFVNLLRTVRTVIGEDAYISIAVSPNPTVGIYKYADINKIVNSVHVMTYDFRSPRSSEIIGQNAPLYSAPDDSPYDKRYSNVNVSINSLLNIGISKDLMVMGIPFYGYSYLLANPDDYYVGSNFSGPGTTPGSYKSLCDVVTNNFTSPNWTYEYDNVRRVPYMYNANEVVVYDNIQSITEKVLFAKSMNLTGVMIWAVDHDSTSEVCGDRPLLRTIGNNL